MTHVINIDQPLGGGRGQLTEDEKEYLRGRRSDEEFAEAAKTLAEDMRNPLEESEMVRYVLVMTVRRTRWINGAGGIER